MPSSGRLSKSGTRVRTPSAIASGRLDALMTGPASSATVRSSVFSSSRTLPGHGYASRSRIASIEIFFSLIFCSLQIWAMKCEVNGGMSSVRERRGGSGIGMTLIR